MCECLSEIRFLSLSGPTEGGLSGELQASSMAVRHLCDTPHTPTLSWHIPFSAFILVIWTSLVAQLVKNLPAMWETWVPSLGWEGPLEKGTATYSSILAWRMPWIV